MNELIKKGLLIGLGATLTGKEKADKFFSDLSKSGSVASGELKSVLDSLGEKGKNRQEQWRTELRKDMSDAIKDLGFVTTEEFNAVKAKVAELEAAVAASDSEKKKDEGAAE